MGAVKTFSVYMLLATSEGEKPSLISCTPHAGRAAMAAQNASRYAGVLHAWVEDFSGNTVAVYRNGNAAEEGEPK